MHKGKIIPIHGQPFKTATAGWYSPEMDDFEENLVKLDLIFI